MHTQWSKFASKYRGDTVEEKYEQMLDRYRKVVSDSETDNSEYRIDFSRAHQIAIELLDSHNCIQAMQDLLVHISRTITDEYVNQDNGDERAGTIDAYMIIAFEILLLLGIDYD